MTIRRMHSEQPGVGLRTAQLTPTGMARCITRRRGWPVLEPLRIEPATNTAAAFGRIASSWMDTGHNMVTSNHEIRNSWLRDYAEQGNLRGIRKMLREGANVKAIDDLNETAMDKARAQFHSEHIGFSGKLLMLRIIKELKKAEEHTLNPETKKESIGVIVSDQVKKVAKATIKFTVGIPLTIVTVGAVVTAGLCGSIGLITYPFEIVYGNLPEEFTKFALKIPNIPHSISTILAATGTIVIAAVGMATFNSFFMRKKEFRNLAENIKTETVKVCKTAFICTSFSGYLIGAVANIAHIAQTGIISQAGGVLLVAGSFTYRLSRFLMENEKFDYAKFLKRGAQDLAIAALTTVAIGAGIAYYNGVAIWTGNFVVPAAAVANYALVRWLLRNKKKR
ncbi:MAG: hypothetical protein ABID61_04585 [Candidatus Micrarchaeota archaeon]